MKLFSLPVIGGAAAATAALAFIRGKSTPGMWVKVGQKVTVDASKVTLTGGGVPVTGLPATVNLAVDVKVSSPSMAAILTGNGTQTIEGVLLGAEAPTTTGWAEIPTVISGQYSVSFPRSAVKKVLP